MNGRLTLYGNWSAYDELSDGIELTEHLAMTQMAHLLRLRDHGLQVDGYLMDAFWYDPQGAYRSWRQPNWPNGPDRWFAVCAREGLIPGLWFTANTLCHLNLPDLWKDSADPNGWGLCLFEGGFLEDYLGILDEWYDRGVRVFKIDFADFTAAPEEIKQSLEPWEIRAKNVSAYRGALARFRATHPDATLMAFNGFEDRDYMDRTDRPFETVLDLTWLDVFDSIYCGDPRPADLPAPSFWRSVDIYADHTTRLLAANDVPLGRIDNCGFMAGPTGTCYWRSASAWKGMLALTYARGGDITVLYGDLSQFSDEDAEWIGRVQSIYALARDDGTKPIGGIPGAGECYAWATGRTVVTAVNPAPEIRDFPISILDPTWRVILADQGFDPLIGEGMIRLGPFQLAVVASDPATPDLATQTDVSAAPLTLLMDVELAAETGEAVVALQVSEPGEYILLAQQRDEDGRLVRTFPAENTAVLRIEPVDEVVRLEPVQHRVVWSGMSWQGATLSADAPGTVDLKISWNDPKVARVTCKAWRRIS